MPLLCGFLINWRALLFCRRPELRLAARFTAIFIFAAPPLLTRSDIGLTWGARHFLVVMPFLITLSLHGIAAAGFGRVRKNTALAALAVSSLLIQLWGFTALAAVTHENRAAEDFLEAFPGEIIVSDVFFLPEQTPRLLFSRLWLGLENDDTCDALTARLRESGVSRFTLVLSPRFRRISDAALGRLLAAYPPESDPVRFAYPGGGGVMELFAVGCRRAGSAPGAPEKR